MKNRLLTLFVLFSYGWTFGQMQEYEAKIPLNGISNQWHSVPLPIPVFDKLKQDLTDIRVYGTTKNDTIEAPYLLKVAKGEKVKKQVDFKLLNKASNAKGYYFTYEIPTIEAINKIQLHLKNENIDAKALLEGSQNQNEWFTILEDYKILTIKNNQTDYSFTELNFPNSKYKYYRLLLISDIKPDLDSASISLEENLEAEYQEYKVKGFRTVNENKKTYIEIYLKQRVPLSHLKINVLSQFDYYRPISIKYVTDSIETEKGWKYYYRNLSSGILTSVENNEFEFLSTLVKKLRVEIQNYDNQPLKIGKIEAKGYMHVLVARFTEPADYSLVYGNKNAPKPIYDIAFTKNNTPENLSPLVLGKEEMIPKTEKPQNKPLFENKWWLWGIMGLLILVLGGFTLTMLQKKG